MKTLSLSEAKMKLSSLVEAVNSTDEEVVITKNGSPAAVLVSPDEFESWKETIAVRTDLPLMQEIKEGLKALKARRHGYTHLRNFSGNISGHEATYKKTQSSRQCGRAYPKLASSSKEEGQRFFTNDII